MLKPSLLVVTVLLLGACASPSAKIALEAAGEPQVSDEMECMTECLQEDAETCESCAAQCLKPVPAESVASSR